MRTSFFVGHILALGLATASTSACSSGKTTFQGDDASTNDATTPPDASNPGFDAAFGDGGGAPDAPLDGKPNAVNLIPNGDFEQGNTLFGSDYSYATINTVEGEYTVGTNGQAFNGALEPTGDHTSGSSLMFIGNGKATPDRVWFTTSIAVAPNTQYYFEAWVMNLCCASGLGDGINPVGPSVLSFYANGQLLGTRTSAKLGVWEGLSTVWDSGSSTTVDLKLVNANTEALGNDFAVDDVYLGTVSTVNPN
jgi:hypothetical protein